MKAAADFYKSGTIAFGEYELARSLGWTANRVSEVMSELHQLGYMAPAPN